MLKKKKKKNKKKKEKIESEEMTNIVVFHRNSWLRHRVTEISNLAY